jgi:flagellar hook assembly protein FlgD
VYNYTGFSDSELSSEDDNTIYIDWDGRNNDGKELASGVYYYQAEVTFDVVDPGQAKQTLKGWIQLLR